MNAVDPIGLPPALHPTTHRTPTLGTQTEPLPVIYAACCRKDESRGAGAAPAPPPWWSPKPSTQASTGTAERCAEKMQFMSAL